MDVCERHGRIRCWECAEVQELKGEVERLREALVKITMFAGYIHSANDIEPVEIAIEALEGLDGNNQSS